MTNQGFPLGLSTGSATDEAGRRMARWLHGAEAQLAPDITERLRFARERAVERARQLRHAPAVVLAGQAWGAVGGLALAGAGASAGGTGPSSWSGAWRQKAASFLPLIILALGFWVIQEHLTQAQIDAASEVDAALLSDDLPPQAYTDPGFVEFLRHGAP